MSLKLPALDPRTVDVRTKSGYPEPYRSHVLPREKRALGDACGLSKIGVNCTTLFPGKVSSMRHWHSHEDEFVYVLEGEIILKTDAGEQTLTSGMCAGFKAGVTDGHQFLNRSARPAVYLEISNRDPLDTGDYSEADLRWNAPEHRGKFTRKDGEPC
jgi:uncharacterized cupin superfamily protein